MEKYKISKNFLIEEYINKLKSVNQIAKELNISYSTISRRLDKYNILRRRITTYTGIIKEYTCIELGCNSRVTKKRC